MKTEKIFDDSGNRYIREFSSNKVEKVDPYKYYRTYEIEKRAITLRDLLYAKNPFLTSLLDDNFFIKKAEETLDGFFEKIEKIKAHENFYKLLETPRKKDQVALLKGMSLNPDQLISLILYAHKKLGYQYSKYSFENLPNGFEGKKLPKLFLIKDDGQIDKFGETNLTDGELKNLIEHRKVITSHFLEKDHLWHCIFTTHDSISGKESWKDGQPHFHYISSGFGITMDAFVDSMRTGKYISTKIHIDLLEYGKQPS
ncbi:hypothetical protein DSECCO2_94290 [anaerobic digester metagenome]